MYEHGMTTTRRRRAGALAAMILGLALALVAVGALGDEAGARPGGEAAFLKREGPPPPGANDPSCRPSRRHPVPVVLVHGTFEDMAQNWALLSPRLRARGYCVYALNYGDRGTGPIQRSARELDVFVDRVLRLTGARKVSIVGHSQGGMMPRYWIKFLGGGSKVDDLIGLAPSNHGTELNSATRLDADPADWGLPASTPDPDALCRACAQQRAGSAFLRRLNRGDETPGRISYTVVATRYDEIIIPYTRCFLRGSPPRLTRNVTLQRYDPANTAIHQTVYNDPDAVRLVFDALSRRGPARPGAVF